ncbi:MAG: tripartite tricarboxylate transporter substrate-binding protein [Betaproteobacteria bacterium]
MQRAVRAAVRTVALLTLMASPLVAIAADYVLVVHPSVPADTLAKLRELAGEQPRGLTFADAGDGSATRRAARRFAERAHLEVTQVSYSGNSKALAAVVAGEAAATFTRAGPAATALKSGKLRALAVTGPKRPPGLPAVPTFDEAGLPGFSPGGRD